MSDISLSDPATDDAVSSSAIALIGLLVSLVAVLLVGVIVAVGWQAGGGIPENDSRSATAGLPDLEQELSAQLWVLQRSESSVRVNDQHPVSLAFADDQLSGFGPCNAYWARIDLDEDDESLAIERFHHTSRECSVLTMRAEREYFAALRSMRDIDLDDRDHLVLRNPVGNRLSYDAYDADDELTHVWGIDEVGRDGALEAPIEGTRPVLSFDEDGDMFIRTGCNTLRSSWALDGAELDTGSMPGIQTLKHCDEPDGLQDQEATLARVLTSGARVHFAPGRLTIVDRSGDPLLVATSLSASP